jgi:hypothetical protein
VNRSDSKNPSTTCRGITSNGRPCRRPVTPAASAATLLPRARKGGIVLDDPRDESLYCWQHKEQATHSARSSPGPRGSSTPILEERTSLDTLADRLGLVDVQQKNTANRTKRKNGGPHVGATVPSGQKPVKMTRPKQEKTLHFCFCFTIPLDEIKEDTIPVRPQPRPVQIYESAPMPRPTKKNGNLHPSTSPSRPRRSSISATSPGKASNSSRKSTSSQTAQYLSLIPHTTEPQTASLLMAELARPYVDSEEAGYIYMFWLTPISDKATPPVEAARSLLAPPSPARGAQGQRRPSDVVSKFANSGTGASNKKTMLLKIGRAANVQRRMNQWSRQCGYDIEVIRYYPYLPGSSEASGMTPTPRMTPHAHRVERLVHMELTGMGCRAQRDTCEACGKDHREWFQVNATRDGIRAVDEVIRRWVDWDETNV